MSFVGWISGRVSGSFSSGLQELISEIIEASPGKLGNGHKNAYSLCDRKDTPVLPHGP